jgi:uncharacterized protein (TIGR03083 family)
MDFAEHLAALRREGDAFRAALPQVDLGDPVAACPGWTVRDVALHTGAVHRKFAMVIRGRLPEPPAGTPESIAGGWPPDTGIAAWFADGHAALLDALAGAPADLECYTLWPAPSARDMWARRQAHETAIHRADVVAPGGDVPRYPAEFAADGIDEVLTRYRARPGRSPVPPQRVVLSVRPDDVDTVWTVVLGPELYEVHGEPRPADVVLTGAASDLYLRLWNRPGAGSLAVSGDPALLAWW